MNEKQPSILVVEDDPGLQNQLKWCFDNFEVVIAENRKNAIAALRRYEPQVVTLDLGLPPDAANASEGLATLKDILTLAPHTKVIVVTGNDDRSNALKAIELGAYDFYQKPIDPEVLHLIVQRAQHLYSIEQENRTMSASQNQSPLDGIIATSPSMIKVCRMIERVAPTNVTTLLLGDSGTGKEVLAKALHNLSSRKDHRLVAINCAAIPDNLLESELFGYEKGAFTGAVKQTKGKIEYAHNGTLFLDEIGDLPMPLQAKLLRFLQERVIERIGGRDEIAVDVRVLCATHRNLSDMVSEGSFREDLFYRLSEITIDIPPLKDRSGDILLLAKTLLTRFNKEQKRALKGFSQEAIHAMENYVWPGNVRELENKIKRAIIMSDDQYISADDLQLEQNEHTNMPFNLREVRDKAEVETILRAITYCDSNISKAAELLGLTRPTLYSLMAKHHIENH